MGCCCSRGQATVEEEGPLLEEYEHSQRAQPEPIFSAPQLVADLQAQMRAMERASLLQCLPSIVFEKGTRLESTECVICLGEYHPGQHIRFLSCMHSFHQPCVDDWLIKKFACPICGVPPIALDTVSGSGERPGPRAFLSL